MARFYHRLINKFTRLLFPMAVVWWKLTKPTTRGVKVVIENGQKELLLIKVTYLPNAAWVFPGGKIEKNESAAEAAAREVFEETGVKLNEVIRIGEYFSDKWGKQDTVTVFYGRSGSSKTTTNEFEIKEVRWFALDKLPPLPENNAKVLEMFKRIQ